MTTISLTSPEVLLGEYGQITVTDLSTKADGSSGEILPDGFMQLDEGGVIRWKFTREDASVASQWSMGPTGQWQGLNQGLTDYDKTKGLTVRMEVGEFEKIVTLNLSDDDKVAYWDQQTSWRIFKPKDSPDLFLTPDGRDATTAYNYKVADNDIPNVTAHVLSLVDNTYLVAKEGGVIRWMFERTDFSKEMVLKVTPGSLGFMHSIYQDLNDWAEPIYVRFEAGSPDPIYLDIRVPDNHIFNGTTHVGLNVDPYENVTGVFMENFGEYAIPFSSESGRRMFVSVTDDEAAPTVAVHAVRDAILDTGQFLAEFEIVRQGDIRGITKVKVAWDYTDSLGHLNTYSLDLEFKEGDASKTLGRLALDVPDGVVSKEMSLRIVEAKNYMNNLPLEKGALDIVTQECATVTVLNPDEMAAGPIARFYNPLTGEHFLTASPAERDMITATMPVFQFEGEAFSGLNAQVPGAKEVWRFYDTASGNHFFTASDAERDDVLAHLRTFHLEGVGFHAAQTGGVGLTEVYRFYNTVTGDHLFTTSTAERQAVLQHHPDYVQEGIAFYVPQAESIIA